MPKKIKKPISRKPKTKNKNVVNVKINIDNSKKSTARRNPMKPSNMQPFVNFPSYQPTRIQQLEPLKKYNNGDLTKTDDMYQKQFKNYLETTDKTVKEMIEKFDDTLKKNTAPQKTEVSKPGALNAYATDEGETILEEPISKVGHNNWSKPNELKQNVITETEAEAMLPHKLVGEAEAIDENIIIDNAIQNASLLQLNQKEGKIKEKKKELSLDSQYLRYVEAYNKLDDENIEFIDIESKEGKKLNSTNWGRKAQALEKKYNDNDKNKNKKTNKNK